MRGIVALISLIALLLVSCSPPELEMRSGEVSVAYVWSLAHDRSTKIKSDIFIRGRVVLTDKLGEISRSIIVADDSGGVEIKIDLDNINDIIPIYSEVTLHLSGLSVGREGSKIVVGEHPTAQYVVDRIPSDRVFNYITLHDTDCSPLTPEVVRIGDIDAWHMLRSISIDGVHFVDEEEGTCWAEYDDERQRRITTVHHITDGVDTIPVIVNGECRYAAESLPQGPLRITAIVDWHDGAIALRIANHRVQSTATN